VRLLVKVSFPVEAGNAAAKKDGFKVIQTILEQQKPEAAYFPPCRAGIYPRSKAGGTHHAEPNEIAETR